MQIFNRRKDENNREYAYRTLRRNIMTLQLLPGTTINENDISEQLGISRTPVHEAIAKLREELLIEIFPQSGTRISLIDISIMKEGYFLRSIVEPKLVEQLAGSVKSDDVALLNANLAMQKEIAENPDSLKDKSGVDDFFKLDDKFHHMIYELAGKLHIWDAVRSVCSHCDRIRYLDAMSDWTNLNAIYEEHKLLSYYLLIGIPDGIDIHRFFEKHLGTYQKQFMKLMENNPNFFST